MNFSNALAWSIYNISTLENPDLKGDVHIRLCGIILPPNMLMNDSTDTFMRGGAEQQAPVIQLMVRLWMQDRNDIIDRPKKTPI